jgi:hypothetical protein
MSPAYTPDEIRQLLAARILTLVVTDGYSSSSKNGYGHGANDAWREADEPLLPEWEPSVGSHLAFWVDDRELLDTRQSLSVVEDPANWPEAASPIVVRFLFELRAGTARKRDWDGAARAGVALFRHLLAEGWTDALTVSTTDRPVTRKPLQIEGDDWLMVEVRVRVRFKLSLAEPSAA